mmetsp:Transcript_45816/g.55136  ORF Transcript_45816/g.55136 Transcript_45816/m.55136 type:complete len:142 (+) Transcript_45816:1-426(+)
MSVLENNFLTGIRGDDGAATKEPITVVPSFSVIFPQLSEDNVEAKNEKSVSFDSFGVESRVWAEVKFSDDKYVMGMKKYSTKMARVLKEKSGLMDSNSWARRGANQANDLCDAIFDRIESLRGENIKKNIKQRALIDCSKP